MTADQDDEQDRPSLSLFPDEDHATDTGDAKEDKEDDEDEEDSGGGSGDPARLALDVPEPEQALAVNEALAGKGKNPLKKKGKGEKGRAGIDVVIGDALIGPEEGAAEDSDPDAEEAERSAFDTDEITDPDSSDIDPLMTVLGVQEKPWENESLTLAERMMMPGYERNAGVPAEQGDGPEQGGRQTAKKTAATVAGIAAGVATGVVAGAAASGQGRSQSERKDQDQNQDKNQGKKQAKKQDQGQNSHQGRLRDGSGLGGIAKGPQDMREQGGALPSGAETRKEQAVLYQPQNTASTPASAPKSAVTSTDRKIQAQQDMIFDQNLMEMLNSFSKNGGLVWNPATAQDNDLAQAMNMIYASLALRDQADIPADRRAGWEGMRQEHRENSKDMTLVADAPETGMKGPEHRPETRPESGPESGREAGQEQVPQINLGPGGV